MSTKNLLQKILFLPVSLLLALGLAAPLQAGEQFTQEEIASSPYLQSVLRRMNERYDTSKFRKEGPYRIALAAQGTSNSWSALFDEHAFSYAKELGKNVIEELLYADAQASADNQVPQVEDLLAQEPDALILVPMGAAALTSSVERAMAQGVPLLYQANGSIHMVQQAFSTVSTSGLGIWCGREEL